MTRNEKIAERMHWSIYGVSIGSKMIQIEDRDCFALNNLGADNKEGHWLMHLMVQKLVEEGWRIIFCAFRNGTFEAEAIHEYTTEFDELEHVVSGMLTAPAAVFELACKCWGIE